MNIPDTALSNIDINKYAKKLGLRNFRGCYMRDELNNLKSDTIESGILNLNLSTESGSHWTCWYRNHNKKYYFDSFGLSPPNELVDPSGSKTLARRNWSIGSPAAVSATQPSRSAPRSE